MRKIIQLSNDQDGDLLALCNDGTVWYYSVDKVGWKKLYDIPQIGYIRGEDE